MPIVSEQRRGRDGALTTEPQGHILVVDDEGDIRNLMGRVLQGLGYKVLLAADGEEALFYLVLGQPIRLILCNLRMPYMSGPALYGHVAKCCPALSERFVFCSGDVVSDDSQRFLLESGRPTLAKPFELHELEGTVRRYDRCQALQLDSRATRQLLALAYQGWGACWPAARLRVAG